MHGNRAWQQSWSHSNAICNQRFKKRIELRTQEQPLVAEHSGGTNSRMNDRSRNRRTDEVPCIAGCSHFTRKNGRFRALASSLKQSPCNIHAASTLRFAASRSKPACCIYAHGNTRWQQSCSHYTTRAYCYVMSSLTPQSHTTLHWVYSYVKSNLTPQSHTTLHWVYCYVMSSLTPQSHTNLHWVYSYVMSSLTPPFIECIVTGKSFP